MSDYSGGMGIIGLGLIDQVYDFFSGMRGWFWTLG